MRKKCHLSFVLLIFIGVFMFGCKKGVVSSILANKEWVIVYGFVPNKNIEEGQEPMFVKKAKGLNDSVRVFQYGLRNSSSFESENLPLDSILIRPTRSDTFTIVNGEFYKWTKNNGRELVYSKKAFMNGDTVKMQYKDAFYYNSIQNVHFIPIRKDTIDGVIAYVFKRDDFPEINGMGNVSSSLFYFNPYLGVIRSDILKTSACIFFPTDGIDKIDTNYLRKTKEFHFMQLMEEW